MRGARSISPNLLKQIDFPQAGLREAENNFVCKCHKATAMHTVGVAWLSRDRLNGEVDSGDKCMTKPLKLIEMHFSEPGRAVPYYLVRDGGEDTKLLDTFGVGKKNV